MALKVLNVGGGSKDIAIPKYYDGWTHHILDIDPKGCPDVLGDGRYLKLVVAAETYDAVYCSHNIEHYYPHDVSKVLRGFLHVLKPNGFADIRCPDVGAVMREVAERDLDIEDTLYEMPMPVGPISVRDVLYGYGKEIERSGADFYAHKTGFTRLSLARAIHFAGFRVGKIAARGYELIAYGFKGVPTEDQLILLGIT